MYISRTKIASDSKSKFNQIYDHYREQVALDDSSHLVAAISFMTEVSMK